MLKTLIRKIAENFRKMPESNRYRVVRRFGGYEPQHSYTAGLVEGVFWYPLNEAGYWLEPDAFTHGKITKHITMPKADAQRAILRARAINQEHINAA